MALGVQGKQMRNCAAKNCKSCVKITHCERAPWAVSVSSCIMEPPWTARPWELGEHLPQEEEERGNLTPLETDGD